MPSQEASLVDLSRRLANHSVVPDPRTGASADDRGGIRHHSRVTIGPSEFLAGVRETNPQLDAVVAEHLADHDGEVLLHLLVADLRRLAHAAHVSGDSAKRDAVLELLDWGLRDGDEALENAVSVSFVEDSGWWEPGMVEYVDSWPPALTEELRRQQSDGA